MVIESKKTSLAIIYLGSGYFRALFCAHVSNSASTRVCQCLSWKSAVLLNVCIRHQKTSSIANSSVFVYIVRCLPKIRDFCQIWICFQDFGIGLHCSSLSKIEWPVLGLLQNTRPHYPAFPDILLPMWTHAKSFKVMFGNAIWCNGPIAKKMMHICLILRCKCTCLWHKYHTFLSNAFSASISMRFKLRFVRAATAITSCKRLLSTELSCLYTPTLVVDLYIEHVNVYIYIFN